LRRLTLSLLVLGALALPAGAQSVTLPEKVELKPGRLVAVTVTYDGDDLSWQAPAEFDAFREYDPDPKKIRLRLFAPPETKPGEYRFLAVTCKGGKLSPFAVCIVTVPGPPAPPPPPPPPPEPTDPLYLSLKAAWQAEPAATRAVLRDRLAAIYEVAVGYVTAPRDKTQGELIARVKDAAKAQVGDPATVLPVLRQAIAAYLKANLVTDPAAPIDPRSAAAFSAVAKALEALK
jgi:hypothetical protein